MPLARHIIEASTFFFFFFFFFFFDIRHVTLTCDPAHVRFYTTVGFADAPGTERRHHPAFDAVVVCLYARKDAVPDAALGRVLSLAARIRKFGSACRCPSFPECLGGPYETGEFRSVDLFCPSLALEIVGTDPDGRLYHEVREKSGLSYDLWADLPGGAGWAALAVGAVAERRAELRLRRAIDRVFETAATEGFRDEEIARARRKVRYRYARLSEAKLDRAAAHAASVLYGAPRLDEAESIVCSLRREEIEGAWRRALRGPRLTGVLTGS